MAYRRPPSHTSRRPSKGKVTLSQVAPIWNAQRAEVNTAIFTTCLLGLGIYDLGSYWRKLRIPIVICMFIGIVVGLVQGGFKGIFIGVAMGFVTPAAAIWLGLTLFHIAVILVAFVAAWAAILFVGYWILSGIFGR
jgi:hypothetical protein